MKLKNYFNKIFKSWWFILLILGVVLRLVLMPITLHVDLWGHSFSAYFLAYEGRLNIYETLVNLPSSHPLVRNFGVADIFIYPPLTYYTLGFFKLLMRPFSDASFIPWLMSNLDKIYTYPGLLKEIFLSKLPYLFLDVALAFFLAGLFKKERLKKISFALWMFNPLALYATFMVGQLDILPVFFVVLSLYFFRRKPYLAAIFLGIGGAYKMFPLLFILPLAFVVGKTFFERFKLVVIGFLPFFLSILPFINSSAFRSMVLFSPKSQKMLFMGWNLSGAEVVYPFILFLMFFYFLAWFYPKRWSISNYFIAILLLIFSVTHYHPQWFLWVTPFLIYDLVKNKFKNLVLVLTLFVCWLIITLLFEPSLSLSLFNPIFPELNKAVGLSEILSKYTDVFQFKSLIRSVFAATSLFYIFRLFKSPLKDDV